ncbi:MAG: RluA family pseudouridine synthase [Dissulfurimicrobium sp.]|uniref:RluA family pseudouridine synthase n=1 Tax=Dissulfurimicrobium TaxID=1769732 RepID=UPI001EDC08FB|nr:RluA family pseudouridine synthase [Dissulfurimicrobium hydrothermale]UKL13260.1 RluA family pseudouridine synthase [Dissulfurimicrobium hydrothermale]
MDHNNPATDTDFEIKVEKGSEGERLDKYLASKDIGLSRTRIQRLIETGRIKIRGTDNASPSMRLKAGFIIDISIPPSEDILIEPLPIPIEILYEDNSIIVINKPAGIVVHPGAGKEKETLVHALMHHCRDLSGIGGKIRPGIVHRLDKDTSGLMVAAKNDQSHWALIEQFKAGLIKKTYMAIVHGKIREETGTIDLPIGRHPRERKKMSVFTKNGRRAVTIWTLEKSLPGASLLSVDIRTGRTHQIRVHMAHIGHPLLGDCLYGGRLTLKAAGRSITIPRQMLHSSRLGLIHPATKKEMEWTSGIPEDMIRVIEALNGMAC